MPKKQIPTVEKPAILAPHARHIIRSAIKVSLATNDRKKPWPFLSLTSVATLVDCTPVLLLSSIAHHTRNIAVDPHVALLFDNTTQDGNPLEGGRITLHGILEKNTKTQAKQRFMARHPEAFYASFADFDFYSLHLKSAHYVAGFGSTNTLSPAHLLLPEQSHALEQAETDILIHMNDQHTESVQLMGNNLQDKNLTNGDNPVPSTPWRMTGLDPEGCDLMADHLRQRFVFPKQVTTLTEVRLMLKEISQSLSL